MGWGGQARTCPGENPAGGKAWPRLLGWEGGRGAAEASGTGPGGPDPGASLQEIFGPVLAAYVYPDEEYKETLRLVDSTSSYGLTGAVFAQDR